MSIAEGLDGIFEDPSLVNRANTWGLKQNFNGGLSTTEFAGLLNTPSRGFGINGPGFQYLFAIGTGFSNMGSEDVAFANTGGRVFIGQNVGGFGYAYGTTPSALAPAIVSGTVYQNTSASYQTLYIPVYASTAGTAGTAAVALGTSSTPATIFTQYVSGGTSSTSQEVITLRTPPQWYYSITLSGATLGTVTQTQE